MMYGEVKLDLICSVLERILSERNNAAVKVTVRSVNENEDEERNKKTA